MENELDEPKTQTNQGQEDERYSKSQLPRYKIKMAVWADVERVKSETTAACLRRDVESAKGEITVG